jgi:hypothetical protein
MTLPDGEHVLRQHNLRVEVPTSQDSVRRAHVSSTKV